MKSLDRALYAKDQMLTEPFVERPFQTSSRCRGHPAEWLPNLPPGRRRPSALQTQGHQNQRWRRRRRLGRLTTAGD